MEALFFELEFEKKMERNDFTAKIVHEAECQFQGGTPIEKAIIEDMDVVKEKLKAVHKKLRKYKNIKNPRLKKKNEKLAQKRKKIKQEISSLALHLQDLEMELAKKRNPAKSKVSLKEKH